MRLAFAVVRVLAENDHFHLIGRGEVERVKHGFALWINCAPAAVALLQAWSSARHLARPPQTRRSASLRLGLRKRGKES